MPSALSLKQREGAGLLVPRGPWRRQLACHASTKRCHPVGTGVRLAEQQWLRSAAAFVATLAVTAASWAGPAETAAAAVDGKGGLEYDQVVARRKTINSSMPSSEQSKALLELYREAYTDDAYEGMLRLQEYAAYVEQLESEGLESAPGCEQCEANRIILEKAWQVVANEFYDPSGRFSQAQWAAALLDTIKGAGGALHNKRELYKTVHDMVASLGDPYTEFMAPSQFRRALRRPLPAERNYLAAQYVGVGVQLGEVSTAGGRVVDAPLAGSPAEAAGIVRGDRILDIDGISADKVTLEQAQALLRGPEGSTITLSVAQSSGPPSRLELERRRLPQPALKFAEVRGPAGARVGYLRMFYFSSETTSALAEALHQGEAAGLQGYIIDLRNNPGGTFEEAIAMAADLLPDGRIVTETVRNEEVVDNAFQVGRLPWEVFGPPNMVPLTSQPLVVLVNSSSASASEVLAGALRANGRALLVGEQTFGKGVLQYYFPMSDGSGLKVTVAKYLMPGGYDISRNGGLRPDLVCHDFPRGVLDGTGGDPDKCVLVALDVIDPAVRTARH